MLVQPAYWTPSRSLSLLFVPSHCLMGNVMSPCREPLTTESYLRRSHEATVLISLTSSSDSAPDVTVYCVCGGGGELSEPEHLLSLFHLLSCQLPINPYSSFFICYIFLHFWEWGCAHIYYYIWVSKRSSDFSYFEGDSPNSNDLKECGIGVCYWYKHAFLSQLVVLTTISNRSPYFQALYHISGTILQIFSRYRFMIDLSQRSISATWVILQFCSSCTKYWLSVVPLLDPQDWP